MTIEFPHEAESTQAPGPDRRVRFRPALPWAAPAALALVALFLPVMTFLVPGDVDAVGTVRAPSQLTLHAFGSYTSSDAPGRPSGGPAYGWVWLALLVGFLVAGVWSALASDTSGPAVCGATVGGVGVGSVVTLLESVGGSGSQRANGAALAAGAWVASAAAVLGLGLGLLAVRQPARSKAAG